MIYKTTDSQLRKKYDTQYGRTVRPKGKRWAIIEVHHGHKPTIIRWFRTQNAAMKELRRLTRRGYGRLHLLRCERD